MSSAETGFRTLGKAADVPEGYVMPYYLADLKRRIAVAHVEGKLYAFDDLSPTDGSPLSAGRLIGTEIMSPCDGSRFDIASGAASGGAAKAPLPTYDVQASNGEVQLKLSIGAS